MSPDLQQGKWLMDILFSKIFPGSDGHIQVVKVKFSEKEIMELIAKLSFLKCEDIVVLSCIRVGKCE